jgi:methionyl-tRNA formyltransferase
VRIALISQIPPAVQAYAMGLRAAGHDLVGLLCVRSGARYGSEFGEHVTGAPEGLDIVIPRSRERIAPLLRVLDPELVLCAGFPWKLPAEALAVPPLGVVNFHPSLLPRYRGPIPVAWAIRDGEAEIGVSFHRMDAELDTGPILAQAPLTLGDEHSWDELGPRFRELVTELLPTVLARVERGDPGDVQMGDGEYRSFFEPEYVWIDWSRPAAEIARQVRAWRFAVARDGELGALAELDGERVRVLRVSLEGPVGRPVECGDGTVWIVESEAAD